jgi:K+-sensing histidine kinase KdpD
MRTPQLTEPDGSERLERSLMLRLERFLSGHSPAFVVVLGLLLLALIGLVDAVTGDFGVSVFYLVPVALVTFARGRWMGALVSAAAAIAWSAMEVVNHVTTWQSQVPYWNALTRFYAFMAVVLLIGPMRDAMVWQRDVAAREAADADRLRTLAELRDALSRSEDLPEPEQIRAFAELRDSLARLDAQF